jgi:hypothetical protein
MGALAVAIDLLGINKIRIPGEWGTPFQIYAEEKDVKALCDVLRECDHDTPYIYWKD